MTNRNQNEEGKKILYRLLLLAVAVVYVLVFILDYMLQLQFTFFLLLSLFGFVIITLLYMWAKVANNPGIESEIEEPQEEPAENKNEILIPVDGNLFDDPIMMISPVSGLIIDCSHSAAHLFESTSAEMIGEDLTKFFDAEWRAEERNKIKEGLDRDGRVKLTGIFKTVGGTTFSAELEAVKKLANDRRIISIRFRKQDKSLANEVVNTLPPAAANAEHEEWVDETHLPLAFIGMNYRFVRVNKAFADLLAYTTTELLSMSILDIILPEDRNSERALLSSLFSGELHSSKKEKRFVKRNSEVIWVNSSSSVSRDKNGTPKFVISLAENITQRKRIERLNADKRVKLNSLLQNSEYSILSVDKRHTIQLINAKLSDLLFAQTGIIVETGFNLLDILPEAFHPEYINVHKQAMEGKEMVLEKALQLNNKTVNVEIIFTPIKDEGGFVQSVTIFGRDITKQIEEEKLLIKAKEDAEAATQAKSGFLATMSHEIRTPLNGVIGMGRLLNQTTLDGKQQDFVDSILLSGEALLSVINDILDFSKIESAKMELEKKPFALKRCIEETFDLLASKAVEKNLSLQYSIARDVPSFIVGDITRLRQILMNLVSNALKFTAKGKVTIRVSRLSSTKDDLNLQIEVKDTGVGIPKSRIGKLFAAFSQADASTARTYGGTGLGLAICKNLVELMGGTIHVESVEGQGSNFIFNIHTSEVATGEMPKQRGTNRLANSMVLIISDDKTEADLYANYFKRWGMIPNVADNVQAGLKSLRETAEYNLVLIDSQLISSKALTIAQEVRTIKSKDQLPIVLFNADMTEELFFDYTNEVVSAVIPKNVDRSKVLDILIGVFSVEDHQRSQQQKTLEGMTKKLGEELPLDILIAEDNLINQKLAQNIFEGLGYKPTMASNGLQVIDQLKKKPFDLIFMDVQMPEMDGMETTRFIIQKLKPPIKPIIIAMTAFALEGDKEKCIEAGMDDYISKPFLIEEIVERIKKWGGRFKESQNDINLKTVDTMNNAAVIINETTLMKLKEMTSGADPNFFAQVIQMYVDQSTEIVEKIESLLPVMDLPQMASLAHKLKGSSLNLGANKIAETCRQIELKGKDLDSAGINQLVRNLTSELQETKAAIKRYL